MPLERRQALLEKAIAAGVPVVEDDPYGELCYSGEMLPSLLSMAPEHVIYMGSFSKILAPGLRLGFVVAPEELHAKLVQAKQAADLHTPSFSQRIVYEAVQDGFLEAHIPTIRTLYARQCELMLSALDEYFPAEARWNRPQGGMFIWVDLPEGVDSTPLLAKAIEQNVAFVPGAPFYATAPRTNCLRLSFVTVPADKIELGVSRLGALLKAEIAAVRKRAVAA